MEDLDENMNQFSLKVKRIKVSRDTRNIEQFLVPTYRYNKPRNPLICCYRLSNGYSLGISPPLGSGQELKSSVKILSQNLSSEWSKRSCIQSLKNKILVYLKTEKNELIGCGILKINHSWKRVMIDMFAVDKKWRGNGYASIMIYFIQYKMNKLIGYDLFVCAADCAVPFWSKKKYNFKFADKSMLQEADLWDEKYGNTDHLIWIGSSEKAKMAISKYLRV